MSRSHQKGTNLKGSNALWEILEPGVDSVPVREYVTIERWKRNILKGSSTTGVRATFISWLCLVTVLICVSVLIVSLYVILSPEFDGWSEWSSWSECSQSCDSGTRVRTRSCFPPDPGGYYCHGNSTEIEMCNTQPCEVGPPTIPGFSSKFYMAGDSEAIYLCENISQSIDVNSGSQGCPRINYTNGTWSSFTATCGQGRTFGTEVGGIDGSFYASSGNITSPNHPETYPDEYGVYHWTVVIKEGSLVFQFTALDTNQKRPDCRGNSGVAIYCGMDIPPLQPSHGYFCGRELPPPVRCNAGCAIVRFVSIPAGLSYTGFRLEWSSSG